MKTDIFTFGCFVCLLVQPVQAYPAVVRFNPPDGKVLVKMTRRNIIEMTKENVGVGEKSQDQTVAQLTYQKTADGYRITEVITNSTGTLNGKPLQNPADDLLVNKPQVRHFSTSGELLRITGNEHMVEGAKRFTPTNLHATLEREMLNKMFSLEKVQWELFFRRFIGKKLNVGDQWKVTLDFGSDATKPEDGKQHVITWVEKIGQDKGRTLVGVTYLISTEAMDLNRVDLSHFAQADAKKFLLENPPNKPFIRVAGSRLFDANTLLPVRDERDLFGLQYGRNGPVLRTEHHSEIYREGN